MSELYRKLWDKIYNPHSGCPDVSLENILNNMAEILVANDKRELETVDKFILAIISISGGSSKQNLKFSWTTSAYHYAGINEYDLPYDKADKFNLREGKKAAKSIDKLVKLNLIERKDKLYVGR